MTINYIKCKDDKYLFSFYGHDYKTHTTSDGSFYMIDGGFNYTRFSIPEGEELRKAEISELIPHIRESFVWGKNYNKDGTRTETTEYAFLKDLTTDHIFGIIKYIDGSSTIRPTQIKEIFLTELLYRDKNEIL